MQHLQPLLTIICSISAGIFCIILADRVKWPSILLLLLTGTGLGPHGLNLIQPALFKDQLSQYISLLVALILFEGGTSLKFKQLKDISGPLRQLLSTGVLVTLAAAALGAHVLLKMPWTKAILFGSVLVVTGPTVVPPILKRIKIKEKLHNILKWESILIDPIGVIMTIVLSEILLVNSIGPFQGMELLAARVLIGLGLGFLAAEIMYLFLKHPSLLRFESEEISGVFIFAVNLLFYGISEALLSASGIVTVTVAGILFGNKKLAGIDPILRFKKQLTMVALSVIFILLSANIPLSKIYGILPAGSLFLAYLIVLVRPLSVLSSTGKEKSLSLQEKLFLCFFAPRGIVSAVMASLLSILFEQKELIGRGMFLPVAFYIITGTIIFYSVTGNLTARVLNLIEETGKKILIIGVNQTTLMIAKTLRDCGFHTVFIDTNPGLCHEAEQEHFEVYCGNATDKNFLESLELKGLQKMLAATPNHEANVLVCQLMSEYFGKKGVYRIWDKNDSWENAVSIQQETWGRPLLIGSSPDGKMDVTRMHLVKQKLAGAIPIDEQYYKLQTTLPLFAIKGDTLYFPAPHIILPQDCELFSLST
ncbi:MAG: cation:proton antiporter [Candidatus Omnitrophica bacterium]|nr:cation:proton antiporter [Candidatus Omnitrophota bacterium]